jgi:hypothetical protein
MADLNAEQDNLFKEIDEDLRQQKYANLWKKYGKLAIGCAVALILGVASIKGWEAYQLNQKMTDSNLLMSALKSIDQENSKNAITVLDTLIKNGSSGYSILAKFNQASILAKNGKYQKAIDNYLLIVDDGSVDKVLRDLALIKSAYLSLEYASSDKLLEKLSNIINSENAWRHSAKELSALFAYRSGDAVRAHQVYKELADDLTAPTGMRSRAAEMAVILN